MCAKKVAAPETGVVYLISTLKTVLVRGRWLLLMAVVVGLLAFGWSVAWDYVKNHVLAGSDYQLNPRDIVVTPLPVWIHTDVKAEVIRDASLDTSLSILDENLTVRMANAFSLHPWVAKVNRVSKHHPARVEVEILYRRPAAMVEVAGGLLPVDAEGTLLPSDDFSSAAAKPYPRVARIDSHPAGPVGANWGDVHVLGAAKIADAIGDRWQALKLHRVLAPTRGGADRDVDGYTYELATQAGTRIIWGRPPGNEPSGEPKAFDKVARLERIAVQAGSLDTVGKSEVIDLRFNSTSNPRTALKALK
jgi:hypothetical protein